MYEEEEFSFLSPELSFFVAGIGVVIAIICYIITTDNVSTYQDFCVGPIRELTDLTDYGKQCTQYEIARLIGIISIVFGFIFLLYGILKLVPSERESVVKQVGGETNSFEKFVRILDKNLGNLPSDVSEPLYSNNDFELYRRVVSEPNKITSIEKIRFIRMIDDFLGDCPEEYIEAIVNSDFFDLYQQITKEYI